MKKQSIKLVGINVKMHKFMRKKIDFLIVIYISFLILGVISCGDDCGPFPDRFKVNSLEWNVYEINYSEENGTDRELSEINQNSTVFNQYSIKITPQKESYYSLRNKSKSFNLINSAYACSPPLPKTNDRIETIEIYSNIDFNPGYLKNNNIINLFNIIVLDIEKYIYYKKFYLKDYLLTKPTVPTEMILTLKEPPLSNSVFEFTIKFHQNGKDNDYFEFITNPIEIRVE